MKTVRVRALTPEQRRVAIVSAKAYRDILTSAEREDELISGYAGNMPGKVAAHRIFSINSARPGRI